MKLTRSKAALGFYLSFSLCASLFAEPVQSIASLSTHDEIVIPQMEEDSSVDDAFAFIPEEKIIADMDNDSSDGVDQAIDDPANEIPEMNPQSIYDPKSTNYGTGAPLAEKPRENTKMRSIVAFIASVIIATGTILLTGANSGKNAP